MDKIQGTVKVGGKTYTYRSEMVETYYGPENRVVFTDADGHGAGSFRECKTTKAIVEDFKEYRLDIEARLASYGG